MVTAELAVAIPSVVLVLALCLVAVKAAVDQIRCVDAARVASRAAARGDDPARVRALALDSAPTGAHVQVDGCRRGSARHRVGAHRRMGALPGWELSASAVTPVESAS